MPRSAAFVWSDEFPRFQLNDYHPLKPERLRMAYELARGMGALDGQVREPRPATEEELALVHDPSYVEAVRRLSDGDFSVRPERWGFSQWGDNPVSPGMYEWNALATGGSLLAAELVGSGQYQAALNIAGGLHHAHRGWAAGFCVFNDPAIAIHRLLRMGLRVAYVDIDAHHGDGVQEAFYADPRALTISMHESGRYLFPGTGGTDETGTGAGAGYSANVPLAPNSGDEVYLWAFDEAVAPLVSRFKPDVLFSQLGIDTYFRDPLTHLALTTQGFAALVRRIAALAPRWVAAGGGGYDLGAVARGWTLAWSIISEREIGDEVPAELRQFARSETLSDRQLPPAETQRVRLYAEHTVADLRRRLSF